VLNRLVDLHAIDAPPARWRGGAGSSQLDGARAAAPSPRDDFVKSYRVHPTHWLISTQVLIALGTAVSAFSTMIGGPQRVAMLLATCSELHRTRIWWYSLSTAVSR